MWKKIEELFCSDSGRLSWGRIGSFLSLLSIVILTLMIWKYGKHPDMKAFVDFAKETNTKLALLVASLYTISKTNDSFGRPGSITDTSNAKEDA